MSLWLVTKKPDAQTLHWNWEGYCTGPEFWAQPSSPWPPSARWALMLASRCSLTSGTMDTASLSVGCWCTVSGPLWGQLCSPTQASEEPARSWLFPSLEGLRDAPAAFWGGAEDGCPMASRRGWVTARAGEGWIPWHQLRPVRLKTAEARGSTPGPSSQWPTSPNAEAPSGLPVESCRLRGRHGFWGRCGQHGHTSACFHALLDSLPFSLTRPPGTTLYTLSFASAFYPFCFPKTLWEAFGSGAGKAEEEPFLHTPVSTAPDHTWGPKTGQAWGQATRTCEQWDWGCYENTSYVKATRRSQALIQMMQDVRWKTKELSPEPAMGGWLWKWGQGHTCVLRRVWLLLP